MKEITQFINEATTAFKIADHLAYVTYLVVPDPKLALSVAERLHEALCKCMDALIHHEYLYKRIDTVPSTFRDKFTLLKHNLTTTYAIPHDIITTLADLAALMESKAQSSIEFTRKDKYVIALRDYQLHTITMPKIKRYIPAVKSFIAQVNTIINTHGNLRRTR